ncbi:hypothetical protein I79_022237 [Cricetulus griseus]|uniref:Uncharacterized protein n=1 Tax=Cricetulus griseus TaxID=10029 RepID=G3IET3_CRIGR|nr:hypothetical protein I79_022237 [Cricetulus griseus]
MGEHHNFPQHFQMKGKDWLPFLELTCLFVRSTLSYEKRMCVKYKLKETKKKKNPSAVWSVWTSANEDTISSLCRSNGQRDLPPPLLTQITGH